MHFKYLVIIIKPYPGPTLRYPVVSEYESVHSANLSYVCPPMH